MRRRLALALVGREGGEWKDGCLVQQGVGDVHDPDTTREVLGPIQTGSRNIRTAADVPAAAAGTATACACPRRIGGCVA